jgi:superfamily II DNA or RNA helicase
MADRQHQAQLRDYLASLQPGRLPVVILAWVVPGGGKSRLPGILAERFPGHKLGWFVPRLSLQRQAVGDLQKHFGVGLRDAGNDDDPSRGTRGFVATHTALLKRPDLWQKELRQYPYVVVVDEPHHAKVEKDGEHRRLAQALAALREARPDVWLNMSGTLSTNDGTFIYGMEYAARPAGRVLVPKNSANFYVRYDRTTALQEGQIVPIEFHHADGPVRWRKVDEEERESRLSEVRPEDEGAAVFTALETDLAVQLFDSGIAHWRRHAGGWGKLLVVVDSQLRAKEYGRRLQALGVSFRLAIDDNPEAAEHIRQFRKDPDVRALVTCQMAYEGLDCPEITHVICLTHIRSAPWIEQMLGRAWRACPGAGKKQGWAFVPDDPRMNRVIRTIHAEQLEAIRDAGEAGGGGAGEPEVPTLALGGSIDAIRQQFLDDDYSSDETREDALDFVRSLGFRGDEPVVLALLAEAQRLKAAPAAAAPAAAPERTRAEQEKALRVQIARRCRRLSKERADRQGRDVDWGEVQRELWQRTGKYLKDMTLEELNDAWTLLADLDA